VPDIPPGSFARKLNDINILPERFPHPMKGEVEMQVHGRCNKCGNTGWLEVGDHSREEVERLMRRPLGECPFNGHHVELGKMSSYIELDWDNTCEEEVPTTEDVREQLHDRGQITFTTNELADASVEITGFAAGFAVANVNGNRVYLDFTAAPDGTRIYFMHRDQYEECIT
jgi:hypothetical protein